MVNAMPKRSGKSADTVERQEIPRWRRIEILREKAELHEALGDIDFDEDFDELDEEVFGSDEEYLSFHKHSDGFDPDSDDDDVDIDIDDDPDGDFDDFDDS